MSQLNILIAISGGLDSMALLHILNSISQVQNLKIFSAYIHHGLIDRTTNSYRFKAWKKCKIVSEELGIEFYSNFVENKPSIRFNLEPDRPLRSEEELREFRYECLSEIKNQLSISYGESVYLATAHTSNDLLETRIINLIRGAGEQGVKAIEFLTGDYLRPLLTCERAELEEYIKFKRISYVKDPSNSSKDPFRNWIRNKWLVDLEKKRPGSVASLSRSLRLLTDAPKDEESLDKCIFGESINLGALLELSFENKKRVLARYMRMKNMKNYGNNHILEVIKRLDSPEKEHRFTLLKHEWSVTYDSIKASPV